MDLNRVGEPLKTVCDTLKFTEQFHVPNYQRGYKWTALNVFKLLDDIWTFDSSSTPLAYYCLQNITLHRHESDQVNVVDGQQRLTTTIVILSYLRKRLNSSEIPELTGKLQYGVREATKKFLNDKIVLGGLWEEEAVKAAVEDILARGGVIRADADVWGNLNNHFNDSLAAWKESDPDFDYDHSDIFHLYCAAVMVMAFFERKGIESIKFLDKFLHRTKFLVNVVDDTVDESEIFSKINGFRVPLDGADLIRAIFVTNVARERVTGGEVEREVRLNEERIKLGLELDEMNAWWSDSRHRKYFALFDSSELKDSFQAFNVDRYPINLLYRLYQMSQGESKILLEQFEHPGGGSTRLYSDVRTFHKRLQDWYDNIRYYHYAGFLRCQCGETFKDLFDLMYQKPAKDSSRERICLNLKKWMFAYLLYAKSALDKSPEDREQDFLSFSKKITDGGEKNWYADDSLFKRIMVLLDVISFTKNTQETEYHPLAERMDAAFFVTNGEEKEHVFPQTPISSRDMSHHVMNENGSKLTVREKIQNYWKLIVSRCCEVNSDGASRTSAEIGFENLMKDDWKKFWEDAAGSNVDLKNDLPPIDGGGSETDFYGWIDRLRANKWLADFVQERINQFVAEKCKIDLNSIGNIVLLNKHTNASYGNDFYSDKRWRIMKDYRKGLSIRLHTRSVFAKEFPLDGNDSTGEKFDVWGQRSIERNREFIASEIRVFFTSEDILPALEKEPDNE